MRCESPSKPPADSIQPAVSKSVLNEKKQLSFVYQPGVGFYDKKKNNLEQDLRVTSAVEDVDHRRLSSDKPDENIPTNQENQQKRKIDQHSFSSKKSRPPALSNDQRPTENLHSDKASSIIHEQSSVPIQPRSKSNERSQKHSTTPMVKGISMVKKLSSDNRKSETDSTEPGEQSIPSRGLLLCPKEEPMKKKQKKKITSASTALLDDDSVLDSILFNEIQSVQQQWQQFLVFTMEKELHIDPADGKKKTKTNKFHRPNEFFLAYEDLYNFEGMKHWCPISR